MSFESDVFILAKDSKLQCFSVTGQVPLATGLTTAFVLVNTFTL